MVTADWIKLDFKNDCNEPCRLEISPDKQNGRGWLEEPGLGFVITDGLFVNEDTIIDSVEFERIAKLWKEHTGNHLQGPSHPWFG